ncbi:glutathione S-transferase family protein [Reyranella sp.]|jgi:glutathione S-transferase|uniref:glutathione S-transferase family protein n=1 Tax=Reyranella sp. TaxID=1929291 RepID=UPI0026361A3F|nr:glutathione S-transferase family protein [Reyranella sp.]HQS14421.1 glutathione S-transferase family protein [Reyranella sp.]HQT11418.1 glutathione S-transferase family protein [Reyranella sp.]
MSKMTLYGIWLSGPTYKAGLALSLMGQPFAYKHVDLRAGAHKQPDYLAINRFGQVPALVDGDLKLCQSGSILLYLADKFGKMAGNTPEEKARVREWLFWEFDRLASNIYRPRAIKRGFMKADDNVHQMYVNQAGDALKMLDAALAKSDFLVGSEATIADVAVYGDVAYAEEGAIDLAPYANVKAWMGRVEKLPGFKKYADLLPQQDAA